MFYVDNTKSHQQPMKNGINMLAIKLLLALLFTLLSSSLAFAPGSKRASLVIGLGSCKKRDFFSLRKSISTEAEIADAITLGKSEFEKYFQFPLDDWQLQAGGSILMGHNVIVCAPTGSGKTVVGEMALHAAFDRDLDGVYTTPLKASLPTMYLDVLQIWNS